MDNNHKPKRYTLSLPSSIHEELTTLANEGGVTTREIVIKCLKLGLLAINLEKDPNSQLVIKEYIDGVMKEKTILLM